ncbi:MAG: metallophosphoesterase [Bacilli bacterium]|nr:metallophosphoesterase [Bacilli bacterium]
MKKLIVFLVILLVLIFCYSFYIAPNIILVKECSIKNELIPEGFNGTKIVHFSDLLYNNESAKNLEELIRKINEQKPNITVFTGDLLDGKLSNKNKKQLIKYLKNIKSDLGKYAILGDKDSKLSEEILIETGFIIIEEPIYLYNNDLIPIIILNNCDLENTLETYSICLIHKPDDIKNINGEMPSLILAGHSLGGQIRIPFWGALIKLNGAKKYSDNYYKINDSQMYISYGIGNGNINIRLFNEPSINVYRLIAK